MEDTTHCGCKIQRNQPGTELIVSSLFLALINLLEKQDGASPGNLRTLCGSLPLHLHTQWLPCIVYIHLISVARLKQDFSSSVLSHLILNLLLFRNSLIHSTL